MSEPIQSPEGSENPSAETLNTENRIPRERLNQVLGEKKALEERLAKLEAEQREKETASLAEQGKYKELYEAALQEVEPLRAAKAELEQHITKIEKRNKDRLATIPEDKRAFIPDIDDALKMEAWLDRTLPLMVETAKPQAPKGDGGAKGNVNPTHLKLTAEEETFARMAGMSLERYAAQKARRGDAIDIESLKNKKD